MSEYNAEYVAIVEEELAELTRLHSCSDDTIAKEITKSELAENILKRVKLDVASVMQVRMVLTIMIRTAKATIEDEKRKPLA